VYHPEHLLVGDTLERPRHAVPGVVEDYVDIIAGKGGARGFAKLLWIASPRPGRVPRMYR
jgi:hypothetical protein